MGLDQQITFPRERLPAWPVVAGRLAACGMACQLRMIDGALSFPDETPPDDWRELRLGTPHGMITVRREADGVRLVVWGNAEAALLEDRDKIARAIAELTQGSVRETGLD